MDIWISEYSIQVKCLKFYFVTIWTTVGQVCIRRRTDFKHLRTDYTDRERPNISVTACAQSRTELKCSIRKQVEQSGPTIMYYITKLCPFTPKGLYKPVPLMYSIYTLEDRKIDYIQLLNLFNIYAMNRSVLRFRSWKYLALIHLQKEEERVMIDTGKRRYWRLNNHLVWCVILDYLFSILRRKEQRKCLVSGGHLVLTGADSTKEEDAEGEI